MDFTSEIFSLLDEATGFKKMTSDEQKATLLRIDQRWDSLPDGKFECDDKSMLALFMVEPLTQLQLFDLAEKWNNILLSDREDDPAQVGIYRGMLAFEKKEFDVAYKYFKMAYDDSKDRPFKNRDIKYINFYKNPEKLLKK